MVEGSKPLGLGYWASTRKGAAVFTIWASVVCGVTGYSLIQKRKNARLKRQRRDEVCDESDQKEKLLPNEEDSLARKRKSCLRHILDSIISDKSVRFRFALLGLSICLKLFISIKVSRQIGHLGSLLARFEWKALAHAQMEYALWTIPAAFLNSLVDFSGALLAQAIRNRLVADVHKGLAKSKALKQVADGVPESEQRITNDIKQVSEEISTLTQCIIRPVIETISLSVILSRMMGTRQLILSYGYFALAATWSRSCTPSLTTLSSFVLKSEGEYRSAHNRLKEYAEEIEFARGNHTEMKLLDDRYRTLSKSNVLFGLQRFISSSLDNYAVRYMGILMAISMMVPEISKAGFEDNVGDPSEFLLTCLHLLVNLMGALKDVALAFRTLSELRGTSSRLNDLLAFIREALEIAEERIVVEDSRVSQLDKICLRDVEICTPHDSRVLVSNINMQIKRGENIFICGPNAVGKTSLMRVIAKVWEPSNGVVSVNLNDCMFLTQRPYMASGLSLRQQVLYPNIHRDIDDEEVLEALKTVEIPVVDLSDLYNLADINGLSPGERQRISCARVIISRPAFVFLDEALSVCPEKFEEMIVSRFMSSGITVISISHRMSSKYLHTKVLSISHDGLKYLNSS